MELPEVEPLIDEVLVPVTEGEFVLLTLTEGVPLLDSVGVFDVEDVSVLLDDVEVVLLLDIDPVSETLLEEV